MLTQVRKYLGQSHELQKLGLKVSVEVNRLSELDGGALTKATAAQAATPEEIKALATDLAKPFYQLRAQQEQEALRIAGDVLTAEQHMAYEKAMRVNYVHPKGGWTKVEVVNPVNGKTYKGECHFSIHTIFNRKVANRCAFGKMFRKMLEDCSLGRKRGKAVINGLVS